MSYFDGIKVGDKVWSFEYGWGEVIDIYDISEYKLHVIEVKFENSIISKYNFNGKKKENKNQTLFWNEIKFEIPKKPKIELIEDNFLIKFYLNKVERIDKPVELGYLKSNGLTRNDKETAEKALKQIKKFSRLLALRDQECEDSKGFEPNKDELYYVIVKEDGKYIVYDMFDLRTDDTIKFKSEADAQKICDILNEGRFNIEK